MHCTSIKVLLSQLFFIHQFGLKMFQLLYNACTCDNCNKTQYYMYVLVNCKVCNDLEVLILGCLSKKMNLP